MIETCGDGKWIDVCCGGRAATKKWGGELMETRLGMRRVPTGASGKREEGGSLLGRGFGGKNPTSPLKSWQPSQGKTG